MMGVGISAEKPNADIEGAWGEAVEGMAVPSSQPRFAATLSNGVKVELVGVCEHPSEGKQWWRPDGTLMKEAPYKKVKGKTIDKRNDELNQLREFAVEITGSDSKGISIKYRVPAAGRTSSNLGLSGDGTIAMESIACAFPKLITAHEVHVGLASGGWQTAASQSADSESRVTRETKAGSITWGVPAELKNETVIDVVHPFVEDNVRIVAQDRAGQVVPAHVSRGGGTSMVSAVRLQFPIRLSQVSMFHIQTRPYEWVEFKNVSLKPGVKTDVEVVVGHAAPKIPSEPVKPGVPEVEAALSSQPGFVATLSNGVTVELVGLYHGETIKDLVFWKPDGSSFSDSESQKYRERVVVYPKGGNKFWRFEYGLMTRF
ncbi:MAG: hypothetical protein ACYS21_18595, partial [Planctomycetota bacterium]